MTSRPQSRESKTVSFNAPFDLEQRLNQRFIEERHSRKVAGRLAPRFSRSHVVSEIIERRVKEISDLQVRHPSSRKNADGVSSAADMTRLHIALEKEVKDQLDDFLASQSHVFRLSDVIYSMLADELGAPVSATPSPRPVMTSLQAAA